jgi:hypothetical protein
MIIHATTNVLALPLVFCIWAVDLYLLLACVRLILGKWSGETAARICHSLKPITDPLPMAIRRWLVARGQGRPTANWVPWAITIGGGLVLRHLLILFVVGTAC